MVQGRMNATGLHKSMMTIQANTGCSSGLCPVLLMHKLSLKLSSGTQILSLHGEYPDGYAIKCKLIFALCLIW